MKIFVVEDDKIVSQNDGKSIIPLCVSKPLFQKISLRF